MLLQVDQDTWLPGIYVDIRDMNYGPYSYIEKNKLTAKSSCQSKSFQY